MDHHCACFTRSLLFVAIIILATRTFLSRAQYPLNEPEPYRSSGGEVLHCRCNLPECALHGNVCMVPKPPTPSLSPSADPTSPQCFFILENSSSGKTQIQYGCSQFLRRRVESTSAQCQHNLHTQPMGHLVNLLSVQRSSVLVCCNTYMCNYEEYVLAIQDQVRKYTLGLEVLNHTRLSEDAPKTRPPYIKDNRAERWDQVMRVSVVVVPVVGLISLVGMVVCVVRLLRSDPFFSGQIPPDMECVSGVKLFPSSLHNKKMKTHWPESLFSRKWRGCCGRQQSNCGQKPPVRYEIV